MNKLVMVASLLMVALGSLTLAQDSSALGAFSTLESKMSGGRNSPMTVTLPDGRILFAGGLNGLIGGQKTPATAAASVDLFDPQSGDFSSPGSLQVPRAESAPILLPDGRVLFVGGYTLNFERENPFGNGNTSEIFAPETGNSEKYDLQPDLRGMKSVAALPDGKALVARENLRSASVLDPETGHLTPIEGRAPTMDYTSTPLTLPNGRIVIFGGRKSLWDVINKVVVFNPHDRSFHLRKKPRFPRIDPSLAVLKNGKILISGGARRSPNANKFFKSAEIYDPSSGRSFLTGSPISSRSNGESVTLRDGRVLVTGGEGRVELGSRRYVGGMTSSEIYDPRTRRFTLTGDLARPRGEAALVALPDGRALIAGGSNLRDDETYGGFASAEVFEPNGEGAKVDRISVKPKFRNVQVGQRFSFQVRMRNSGQGAIGQIKVCLTFHDFLFRHLSCPTLEDIPPGGTASAVVEGVVSRWAASRYNRPIHGQIKPFEIYARGQDVNVYSTGRVRIR